MPVITIQVTREGTTPEAPGVTAEQKAQLIKGASELLLNVLGKPMESTFVIIDEVALENWGWGGLPVAEYRQRQREQAPTDPCPVTPRPVRNSHEIALVRLEPVKSSRRCADGRGSDDTGVGCCCSPSWRPWPASWGYATADVARR